LIRLTCGEKQQALVAPLRILIHVIRIHEEGGGASQRERGREGECVCVCVSERARKKDTDRGGESCVEAREEMMPEKCSAGDEARRSQRQR
jgi:hypothetical protein